MDAPRLKVSEIADYIYALMRINGIEGIRINHPQYALYSSGDMISFDETRREELLEHEGVHTSDFDGVAYLNVVRKGFTKPVEYTVSARPTEEEAAKIAARQKGWSQSVEPVEAKGE